jgi:hypothetical protein
MPRKLLALLLFVAGVAFAAPAWASGDFTCQVSWTLKETERTDCGNQPFLAPGNDSRVNLQLLLLDAGKVTLHAPGQARNAHDAWSSPELAGPIPFTLDDLDGRIDPPPPAAAPTTPDAASDPAIGNGTRCDSDADGSSQFQAAVNAAHGVPKDEAAALVALRAALKPRCDDAAKVAAPVGASTFHSPIARQFEAYLNGARAFYAGDFDTAAVAFNSLKSSTDPWLCEASRYMVGRVALNRAQAGAFGEYGDLQLAKVDAGALAVSRTAFEAYLHDYPNGTYAASARGLMRRLAWLSGRPGDLAGELARALAAPSPYETDLVQEADAKLLAGADAATIHEPLLLASFDLMHMRSVKGAYADTAPKPMALAELEAQRPVFAGHEALFDYLLAAHAFYDDDNPAKTLTLLPPTAPVGPMIYLGFSRQVLRGQALEATGDHAGARALWLALMTATRPPYQHATAELALAMNYERGAALAQVFAPGSPIQDQDLRDILLNNNAGPALLRQRAKAADATDHERRVALYALLYKRLTRDRYQAFLADVVLAPADPPIKPDAPDQRRPDPDFAMFHGVGGHDTDGVACPTINATAASLAKDPQSGPALVCLNEFVRLNGLDDAPLDVRPPADELGGGPSQFPGGAYSRLDSYQRMLANPKLAAKERAYVLYRAVECYAPSGANHCTGPGVPLSQRKAWFHTLKTDYPTSPWAEQLKYFW